MKLYRVRKADDNAKDAYNLFLKLTKILDSVSKETEDKTAKQKLIDLTKNLMTAYQMRFEKDQAGAAKKALFECEKIFRDALKLDDAVAESAPEIRSLLGKYKDLF